MKYAVIAGTLYFKDHERKEQFTITLSKNGDEKKQVENFLSSYITVIKYCNFNDFLYFLVDSVSIENVFGQAIKRKELDVIKLDI